MNGTRSIVDRIDVKRIDADEGDAGVDELLGERTSEVRMVFEIAVGPPVRVPPGMEKESFAAQGCKIERQTIDRALATIVEPNDNAVEVRERFEFELRKIIALGVAMKRRIEIGSGIRDHFDFADLEFGSRRIFRSGCFAAEIIANDRGGQTFVGNHTVLDGMAEVDEVAGRHPAKDGSANQMRQEAAE